MCGKRNGTCNAATQKVGVIVVAPFLIIFMFMKRRVAFDLDICQKVNLPFVI